MCRRPPLLLLLVLTIAAKSYSQNNDNLPELLNKLKTAKDSAKTHLLNTLSFYYGSRYRFDSALYFATEALKASQEYHINSAMGNAYNNIGNVFRFSGQLDTAVKLYTKALSIYENNKLYKQAANTLGNIAEVYGLQHQYDKAIEMISGSIRDKREIKDTNYLINAYVLLAENFFIINNTARARASLDTGQMLINLKKSRPYNSESDSAKLAYVSDYFNRTKAKQLFSLKQYDSSIVLYESMIKNLPEKSGPYKKADLLVSLSNSFIALKNYDSALYYNDIAASLLKKDSIPESLMSVYGVRATIMENMGNYREAYNALQINKAFSDSIINHENLTKIAMTQGGYEVQKRDQQITQLNRDKKTQRLFIIITVIGVAILLGFLTMINRSKRLQKRLFRQREDLMIKEKELQMNALQKKMNELEQMSLRAQMNPHFIFNSLNSVQHFMVNQDIEGVNKYLGAFAHLIRQTLNNSGKALISLDEEIKYLDTYLSLEKMKSNNSFNYSIAVDKNIDASTVFVPGMILQPFVENSIKHGIAYKKNKDGQVSIHVSQTGRLVCEIEDNGVGRQVAGEMKRISTSEEYESKGMAITMNRIETINKIYSSDISVQIDDIHDTGNKLDGTRVRVEFPPDLD